MQNEVSKLSAVMRAEQLLDSVEQRIKSFFVHDSRHLQHAATSIEGKSSLFPLRSLQMKRSDLLPRRQPQEIIVCTQLSPKQLCKSSSFPPRSLKTSRSDLPSRRLPRKKLANVDLFLK